MLLAGGNDVSPRLPPFLAVATCRPRLGSRRAQPGSARRRLPFGRASAPDTTARLDSVVMELRDGDLVLRPWAQDDVPALVEACNDPEIPRWIPLIPVPYTAADALAFVRGEVLPEQEKLAIEVGGRVVGSIGMSLNSHGYRGHVGYWVAAPARRRGVCARALRVLCAWGLGERGLQRLELITDPDNLASQRCAEKVGFRREGVMRAHLRHPDGRIRDSVMFSLLPGELVD